MNISAVVAEALLSGRADAIIAADRGGIRAGISVRDRARLCRRSGEFVILATSGLFVPIHIAHPVWMLIFLVLTAVSFSLFGFIFGLWADNFEKLQIVPLLIITPLTFLGGAFYPTSVLPPFGRTVTLFNPLVYLISGFRWSFF